MLQPHWALVQAGRWPARAPRHLPECPQCPQTDPTKPPRGEALSRENSFAPHVYPSTSPAGQRKRPSACACACARSPCARLREARPGLSHNESEGQREEGGTRGSWSPRRGARCSPARDGRVSPRQPSPARRLSEQRWGLAGGLGPGEAGEARQKQQPHRLQWRKWRKFICGCGENTARSLGLTGKGAIRADRTQTPGARSGGARQRARQPAGPDPEDREPGA